MPKIKKPSSCLYNLTSKYQKRHKADASPYTGPHELSHIHQPLSRPLNNSESGRHKITTYLSLIPSASCGMHTLTSATLTDCIHLSVSLLMTSGIFKHAPSQM